MTLVRYFLCLSVITSHYFILNGIPNILCNGGDMRIGVFFAMSGYLIYASYERNNDTKKYFRNRLTRILPTYLTVILSTAILLSLLSSLTLSEYFSSGHFWKYLTCNAIFLNFLCPTLPGVFDTGNILPAVNGALWTLKVEWTFYIFIPIFFWIIRHVKCSSKVLSAVICIISVAYVFIMRDIYISTGNKLYYILSYQFFGQGIYFFSGVLIYHFRKYVSGKKSFLPLLSSIVFYILFLFIDGIHSEWSETLMYSIVPPIISVLMLSFSLGENMCDFQRYLGNYSYEMYLLHFPILQTLINMGVTTSLHPLCGLAVTFILTFLAAVAVSKTVGMIKKKIFSTVP